MQISFADLKLLLDEADKNECLVLLNKEVVIWYSCEDYVLDFYDECDVCSSFHKDDTTVTIMADCILLRVFNIVDHRITIYKQPMTKEECLTTLEFLKND